MLRRISISIKQINTGEDFGYKVQQELMTPEEAAQAAKAAGVSVIPPKHSTTASNEQEDCSYDSSRNF